MKAWKSFVFLFAISVLFPACNSLQKGSIPSATVTQLPVPTSTEISEESLISTEQAKASTVRAEVALTLAAQPTFALLHPTLIPIPNSTPAGIGAYFDVPSDTLGTRYEIQNAYYFDKLETGERYEIYAGALAGSGNEETAQGLAVVRHLQITEEDGNLLVKAVDIEEYLTPSLVGPVHVSIPIYQYEHDPLVLSTSLGYSFIFFPLSGELRLNPVPPRATLGIGSQKQLAGLGHSFCWLGSCQDGPGIRTSIVPLVAQPSFLARLRLPLVDSPQSLHLSVMKVSSTDIPPDQDYVSWHYKGPATDLGDLLLQREQNLSLSFEPGLYVLIVFSKWQAYGDATYAFLIEVQE